MQIAEGIHWLRVPVPVGPKHVNLYVLEDPNGPVLVDAGYDSDKCLADLKDKLGEIGYRLTDIAAVIPTHEHLDHTGLAAQICATTGAKLWLHELCFKRVDRFGNNRFYWSQEAREYWSHIGMPAEDLVQVETFWTQDRPIVDPPEPDRRLADGDVLRIGGHDYRIIWTPGHSEGHICLYDAEQRVLISGDHLLPKITPHIGRDHVTRPNPLADYVASLGKVSGLEVGVVLPGHYKPFTDYAERLQQVLHHHEARLSAVEQALRRGSRSAHDVSRHVFGGQLPFFEQQLAAAETVAHLYYLAEQGRVEIDEGDGVTFYSLRNVCPAR